MIKKNFTPILVIFILSMAIGCASKKTKEGDLSTISDFTDSDFNLEIDSDSDSDNTGPIQTVYFSFNSSSLSDPSRRKLEQTAAFLKSNETVRIQIEGHCDERGGVQYNLALGERRAKSIRQYLVSLGVNFDQLDVISRGKESPVASGNDEDSWSKNRRGNFVVTAN